MKTVAIVAQKGGVGKTTLAIHLATLAELVGLPTVLIDLDPQASASAWKDGREADTPIVTPVPPTRLQQALEAAKEGKAKLAVIDTALQPGKTVLLVAGNGHVRPTLGIPTWLPANFEHKVAIAQAASASSAINIEADYLYRTAPLAPKDHCAALRRQWQAHPPQPAAGQR